MSGLMQQFPLSKTIFPMGDNKVTLTLFTASILLKKKQSVPSQSCPPLKNAASLVCHSNPLYIISRKLKAQIANYKTVKTWNTHLDSLEHIPEYRPLLLLVHFGSVLVAVCGQCIQFIAQFIPVIKLKVLKGHKVKKCCTHDQ